jgi:hypothetical protein
MTRYELRLL